MMRVWVVCADSIHFLSRCLLRLASCLGERRGERFIAKFSYTISTCSHLGITLFPANSLEILGFPVISALNF